MQAGRQRCGKVAKSTQNAQAARLDAVGPRMQQCREQLLESQCGRQVPCPSVRRPKCTGCRLLPAPTTSSASFLGRSPPMKSPKLPPWSSPGTLPRRCGLRVSACTARLGGAGQVGWPAGKGVVWHLTSDGVTHAWQHVHTFGRQALALGMWSTATRCLFCTRRASIERSSAAGRPTFRTEPSAARPSGSHCSAVSSTP